MARWLKQSTAFTFRIGPFVDSTDGVTAETALSIAQADIQISKNGGAFAQTSASPTTTHDADGWYQCPLTSTDTNTLGPLTVQVVMAGALMVWEHFMVVPAAVYDTLVAGIIPMQNNATYGTMQAGSGAGTAVLASATSYADDLIIGAMIVITGGTGVGQSRIIYDWVSTTDTASVSPNWTTTPDNTSTYIVVPTPPAPTNSAALPTVLVSSGTGTGQLSVTSGVVASLVSSMGANTLTASALATDAVTEIQSGLATQASVDTIDNFLDTEIAAILALLDDPRGEPAQGTPPVNPDLATKIDYLYKAWRNRSTQTATQYSLYADDATTVDHKATLSDDGTTYVKGEVATGP